MVRWARIRRKGWRDHVDCMSLERLAKWSKQKHHQTINNHQNDHLRDGKKAERFTYQEIQNWLQQKVAGHSLNVRRRRK